MIRRVVSYPKRVVQRERAIRLGPPQLIVRDLTPDELVELLLSPEELEQVATQKYVEVNHDGSTLVFGISRNTGTLHTKAVGRTDWRHRCMHMRQSFPQDTTAQFVAMLMATKAQPRWVNENAG